MVGFKKTEIGLLPEDWNAVRIKEMYKLNNEQITQSNIPYNEFYYIDLSSVKNGVVTIPQEKIQIDEAPSRAKRVLMQNDVIIATVRPNLKGFAIANFETDRMICSTGFALVKTKNELDAQYLLQNLFSHSIANQIENLVVGSNYPAISNSDVENLIIPQPPLPEQQKIATILSKWDELIETQTQLISTKEKQKTSLMQKMLTGEVRFPGFEDEWEYVNLEDVAEIDGNSLNSKTEPGYTFKYISLSDVNAGVISNNLASYRFEHAPSRAKRIVKNDSIIMATVRPNLQAFARIKENEDVIVSTGFAVIDHGKNLNPNFLLQYLFSKHISNQIEGLIVGSNYPAINSGDVRSLQIYLPSIDEQFKISKLFLEFDSEIQNLIKELELIKLQKKGLMQQLLTGKIRIK